MFTASPVSNKAGRKRWISITSHTKIFRSHHFRLGSQASPSTGWIRTRHCHGSTSTSLESQRSVIVFPPFSFGDPRVPGGSRALGPGPRLPRSSPSQAGAAGAAGAGRSPRPPGVAGRPAPRPSLPGKHSPRGGHPGGSCGLHGGAWPPAARVEPGAAGKPPGARVAAGSLTARSGSRLSRCDTARMTPARQLRQQRPLSPRSGRASSPAATHRNRFPTSSGRVSTAMARAATALAVFSRELRTPALTGRPCWERTGRPRRSRERENADSGHTGRAALEDTATSDAWRPQQPPRSSDSQRGLQPQTHPNTRKTDRNAGPAAGGPQAAGRRCRSSAAASTTPPPGPGAASAPRVSFRRRGGGEPRGSAEPPQTESSARRGRRPRRAERGAARGGPAS